MINIALFVSKFERGGVQTIVEEIANNLPDDEYNVYLCSIRDKMDFDGWVNKNVSLCSFNIKGIGSFCNFIYLIKFLKEKKISIVHSHPGTISKIAGFFANCPIIISTWHGSYSYNLFTSKFAKLFSLFTTIYVANSSYTRGFNSASLKIDEKKILTIYNGINFERYKDVSSLIKENLRNSFKITNEIVICSVGRLHKDKGFDVLVNAIKKVVLINQNVKLLIAGDGPLREYLISFVKKNKLEQNIIILGDVKDINGLLSICNIYVQPSSIREGFGLSIAEAMYKEIPVIASNLGGIPEIIFNGFNGILVEPGNSSILAKEILDLLQNNNYMNFLGKNAKKTIEEKFNAEKMVKQYHSLYLTKFKSLNYNEI